MYNKIILQGNLSRDIEIKYTQGGSAIANTAIATTRKFKSATGEQKEETLFVDITFFGRTAEIANQYLRKGSKVLVDGRLKLDQWTDKQGNKRSKHSVSVENLTMLDNRPGADQATPHNNLDSSNRHNVAGAMNKPAQHQTHKQPEPHHKPSFPGMDENSEIPF